MHNELHRLALTLTKLPFVDQSPDPADNFLLAMAQAGKADVLVTGDKHDLLSLGDFARTRILTARQLLQQFRRKSVTLPKPLGQRPKRRPK